MKPIIISISRLTYTIDFPVILLFIAVSLDVISTTLFLSLGVGAEANATLRKLTKISIWFVPVYLLAIEAIFVPFLSHILRRTFCYTFALLSIVLAVNNFSLIIFDSAFIVNWLGFDGVIAVFTVFGLTLFAYLLSRAKLPKNETLMTCLKFVLFLLFLGLVHLGFVGITELTA